MHFTSFALPLALASLVTASPLGARDPRLNDIDAAKRESVPAGDIPVGTVRAADEGFKRTTGISKYSDFNGLTERDRAATLHVCVADKCGGPCTQYSIGVTSNQCIDTVTFASAYVLYFGITPLAVTVYAGEECGTGSRSSHVLSALLG
jgi:hypothetical protein